MNIFFIYFFILLINSLQWYSINELNKLANLNDLRIRNNPLNRSTRASDFRALVIGKIGNITMFNRTILKKHRCEDERKGDDFYYLKLNALEWLEVKDLNDSDEKRVKFLREHPRYPELVKSIEKCNFLK